LQRDRDIAQHEAAQYRRQKEELENALAEKKDETDVSRRARSESEVLLMNENKRLRAENKELNEVLEKERTSATHANQQFQAHMQQMNRASFDQGTRLQQANNIIRQLQTGNAIEHVDADALRRQRADYMLHQLQIITNGWIHDLGDARGVHQSGAGQLRAYLFTFGSFRLEVDDASADVDVLVMVPPIVDRDADFFGLGPDRTYQCPSLLSRLEQDERVCGIVAVVDAYVPCIKMSFGGIEFDLTFANVLRSDLPQQSEWGDDINSWRAGPGSFAVDGAMLALAHDLPAVRSFVGVHSTHYVLRSMQQHYDTFRQTLVHVKAWAKQQGIYGSMMGYPGGVAWTILTAFYCRERFSAMPPGSSAPPTVGSMLAGFFATWAEWQWPQPVELVNRSAAAEQRNLVLDAEVWHPGSAGTGDAIMPIISPAYPQMNTTHTVGAASFRVIQEELAAAAALSSSAGIGGCCTLLSRCNYLTSYQQFD
jgi:poly(A) polymerase